ncbi:hypothetical protein GCM10010193_31100 [Kitasatospora atroaurantiaca]|uniref:Small secreted domain DUF320 n=1 Tax=Kitasatospora atroaurantiaca TaxID=285545 RepID=A0A561ER57_9ACTN|nr:hypothetical protein [Kitasatospora atroaurantiaca]TWE18097.1 hypothetical protein FB465_3146 [Kitasatospora atroaurantiaca]
MRTAIRIALTGALLATAALAATTTAAAADTPADPAPSRQDHTYSIPVGAITDLGDLTKIGNLGHDLAGLLGH